MQLLSSLQVCGMCFQMLRATDRRLRGRRKNSGYHQTRSLSLQTSSFSTRVSRGTCALENLLDLWLSYMLCHVVRLMAIVHIDGCLC